MAKPLVPFENTLSVSGTAEEISLQGVVSHIEIGDVDKDTFIAKTEAELASAADGTADGRIFVRTGTIGRLIPWEASSVFMVNVTGGEKPTLYGIGLP